MLKDDIKKVFKKEVCNDPGPLISTINKIIKKIQKRGTLTADTINYFRVKNPKLA